MPMEPQRPELELGVVGSGSGSLVPGSDVPGSVPPGSVVPGSVVPGSVGSGSPEPGSTRVSEQSLIGVPEQVKTLHTSPSVQGSPSLQAAVFSTN